MAFGKLYSYPGNPRATAILAVAKANDLELDIENVDFANLSADFLKANKLGKVPTFVGSDGYVLTEAIAIAIYVTSQNEKTTLLGKTKQDYASILKWMSFITSEFLVPLTGWYLPLLGISPYNKKSVDDSSKAVLKVISVLEEHLFHNTYLVGERITLADLFAVGAVARGYEFFFDKEFRAAYPNTTRWYETVYNQPIFSAIAPKLEFIDTPKLVNAPPKKAEKPKKEPAPKAALKPKAKEADEEDDTPPEPKHKHPLDGLPRATFAIDVWKRYYSNNETAEAMKWFWENMNFEEYSLWKVLYKYNEELKLTFMSQNLIGGFDNRLEASRKYLFGVCNVYGENNNSVIQGAFVSRGDKWKPVFDVAPDCDSYDFVKLDHTKPEDREYIELIWGLEKPITVDSKEIAPAGCKVFK